MLYLLDFNPDDLGEVTILDTYKKDTSKRRTVDLLLNILTGSLIVQNLGIGDYKYPVYRLGPSVICSLYQWEKNSSTFKLILGNTSKGYYTLVCGDQEVKIRMYNRDEISELTQNLSLFYLDGYTYIRLDNERKNNIDTIPYREELIEDMGGMHSLDNTEYSDVRAAIDSYINKLKMIGKESQPLEVSQQGKITQTEFKLEVERVVYGLSAVSNIYDIHIYIESIVEVAFIPLSMMLKYLQKEHFVTKLTIHTLGSKVEMLKIIMDIPLILEHKGLKKLNIIVESKNNRIESLQSFIIGVDNVTNIDFTKMDTSHLKSVSHAIINCQALRKVSFKPGTQVEDCDELIGNCNQAIKVVGITKPSNNLD